MVAAFFLDPVFAPSRRDAYYQSRQHVLPDLREVPFLSSAKFPLPKEPPKTLRQLDPKFDSVFPIRWMQFEDLGNPTISIVDLMVITAVCAVVITLITKIGFFGVHGMLIICGIAYFSLANFEKCPRRFRFWNQFIWGILMPLVCIFGDPFVFGEFNNGKVVYIHQIGLACYVFMGWQMLALAASWFVKPNNTTANQLLSGTLFAGSLFCLSVALLILPLTLLGTLFMGIGLPGMTPWITWNVFRNTSKFHTKRCNRYSVNRSSFFWILGFLTPIVVAFLTYFVPLPLPNGAKFEFTGISGLY